VYVTGAQAKRFVSCLAGNFLHRQLLRPSSNPVNGHTVHQSGPTRQCEQEPQVLQRHWDQVPGYCPRFAGRTDLPALANRNGRTGDYVLLLFGCGPFLLIKFANDSTN